MRAVRIIIFLLVVTGLIWLLVVLFQSVFSNGNSTTSTVTKVNLTSYANTDAAATLYIDGQVVANQEHNAVRITVDRNQASIEVIKGYDGQVVAQQVFPNTQASYLQFLSALDKAGYTKGDSDPALQNDAGSCPLGSRYIYTLTDGSKEVLHYWTTSCSNAGGTYGGSSSLTRQLFMLQIPETVLNGLTRNLSLQ